MPIVNRVADLHSDITAWRRDIHEHPELLYDVHRTAAFVADRLREFGCDEVVTGMGKTGVRRLLDWRWMLGVGAVVAAAGAGAAIAMRRRYASATAEAKNATESPEDSGTARDGDPASDAIRSDVNGRVTTPGT